MDFFKEYFIKRDGLRQFVIITAIILLVYFLRKMMNLILLTFIITYLIDQLHKFIIKNVGRKIHLGDTLVTSFIYVVILLMLSVGIYNFVPKMMTQGHDILGNIEVLAKSPDKYVYANTKFGKDLMGFMGNIPENADIYGSIKGFAGSLIRFTTNVGKWGLNIFAALVLSFFFMIDKDKILSFLRKFKDSKVRFIYEEAHNYYKLFINSFGKVLEAQILIAFANTILTIIGLVVMGFPSIFFLTVMILLLSLIPVAGVIISFVPLSLIAFKIGGFMKVIYVLCLIFGIHCLESYFLNPKLMSYKTKLPVFITLMVLFLSENLLGPWGLIFGLPIFVFILELIKDKSPRTIV